MNLSACVMSIRTYLFLLAGIVFLLSFSSVKGQEKNEILIGAPISLSGDFALDGAEQKWAYEKAIAAENKNGGVFVKELNKKLMVKLIIEDDESDPTKSEAAVEKLINNHKVDLLLSTHGGELIMASCAAAERAQKYYHATTCFPHQWLPANYKWSTVYFFDGAAATEVPCKILETVPKAERPKNFALLMEDSPDGIGFTGLAKASVEKYGYAVAMQDPLPIGKEDYSSLIMKMKEKKVDAILILTSPHDAMVMIRQVREMGVNTKFIFGWKGTWTSEFARILGKNSDYILSDGFWSEAFPYPGAKELGQLFFSEFNRNSISAGLFYAHTQVLLKAIASAGSLDSKKVRDAVVGKKFTGTVMGDVKYDAKGVALFEAIANQWVDGKRVLIYPFAGASKMKLIPVKVTY